MLKESANTATRLDKFDEHIGDSKEKLEKIPEAEADIKVLKVIIHRIEKDIVELFRRGTGLRKTTRESQKYDDERGESEEDEERR
jgi:hypothetical protein